MIILQKLLRISLFLSFLLVFGIVSLAWGQQNSDSELDQNLAQIRKAILEKGASWQAGITPVARLSQEQRKSRLGALTPKILPDHRVKESPEAFQFPAKFDWRSNNGNWVTAVKDQANCGSCWDFAAVGAFESLLRIVASDPNLPVDLSEQFVLSCSGGSCSGWWTWRATEFLVATGTPDEDCMPYMADDMIPCSDACSDWQSRVKKLSSWSWVTTETASVAAIKLALLENPVATHMDVYTDFFYYTSGVYEYTSGSLEGGHAIVIIGWDDNPPDGGGGCWIAKNSWDSTWGENGYFRIRWGQSDFGTWTIDQDMPGAEPNIVLEPSEFDTLLAQGQATVQTLAIINDGTTILNFLLTPEILTPTPDSLSFVWFNRENAALIKQKQFFGTRAVSAPHASKNQGKSFPLMTREPLALPPPDQTASLMIQGFEEGIMPPTGWTKIDGASSPGNEDAHWRIDDSIYVYAGKFGAICPWGYNMNEWLISPSLDLSSLVNPRLVFYWESSYYWSVDPYDNGDLFVKVSVDSGITWEQLWTFGNIGPWEDWTWYQTTLDLSAYAGHANVRVAFHIVADDNADIGLDEISLVGDSWINIPQSAGYVFAGDTVKIPIFFDTIVGDGIIPVGDHYANIWVSSDDPDSANLKVPVHLQVSQADYAVAITPRLKKMAAAPGDTLYYPLKVKNFGLNSDDYQLGAGTGHWSTTVLDSNGVTELSNTGTLASSSELKFLVRVEIPADVEYGASDTVRIQASSLTDTLVTAFATLISRAAQPPSTIPWIENFDSTALDTSKWCFNSGPAEISMLALNEPSAPYSLNLNGDALGGDEIQSCPIDLSKDSTIIFSYYYQRTGSAESPDSGDDLWVDYFNKNGNWINLKQYPGDGPDMSTFIQENILLPDDAYFAGFRFRFRNSASRGRYDDWFIDNISLNLPPDITVVTNPEPFYFQVDLGDSTNGTITIGNVGDDFLNFSISDGPVDSFQQASHPLPAPPDIQQVLLANYYHAQTMLSSGVKQDESKKIDGQKPGQNHQFSYQLGDMLAAHPTDGQNKVVRACVVDGWGTYSYGAIPTWDYLNLNWRALGLQEIVIDYTTLNIDNITYDDLVNSGANMLIISDNWGSSSYDFALTDAECQAVKKYINEGHGLYISAGTFNNFDYASTQPQVVHFAELVGISPSILYYWDPYAIPGAVNLLEPSHPLFFNIPNPYLCSYDEANTIPTTGNWQTAITTGKILAASADGKTAIIAKGNCVYYSTLPECQSYGISNADYQFIYNVVTFAATKFTSWLSYEPKSGSIAKDSTIDVTVKLNSVDLIPDSTYARNIQIASNDLDEAQVMVETRLTVNPVDYYFRFIPTSQESKGKAGDTLAYRIEITNFGRLSDSYMLSTWNNSWPVTFWDSTGTGQITQTDPVATKNLLTVIVKVEIPKSTKYGAADTAQIQVNSTGKPDLRHFGFIFTTSVGTPDTIPWSDNFITPILEPDKWIYNLGPALVNAMGSNEPSPNYSLNMNADSTGGDEVHSNLIDLSGDTLVVLSYYYERTGNGESPDYGDDLWVDFMDANENWVNLRYYPGSGPDMTNYSLEEIALPEAAYHNSFQFRFKCKGNYSYYDKDDWFIDNVLLTRPPRVEVNPENYDVTVVVGEKRKETPITIHNSGEGDLRYRIYSIPIAGVTSDMVVEPARRSYPEEYYLTNPNDRQQDSRQGAPVAGNSGGPDNFGYFWLDSDETGGPVFDWVDISHTGTRISGLGDNEMAGPITMGFTFPFYGNHFDAFYICSNGYITFTSSYCNYYNQPIPNNYVANLIAPFWDDLEYDYDSDAYYHFDGEKLIIQSHNVRGGYYSNVRNTFEIQLYPDGTIKFQYLEMLSSSYDATVGIQNSNGTDGLEIAFNTTYVHGHLAVLITNQVSWLELTKPSDWIIPSDSTDVIEIVFNAQAFITDKDLTATIFIKSNDPLDSLVTIPAHMTVLNKATISGKIMGAGKTLNGAVVQVWDSYPNGLVIDSTITDTTGAYSLKVPPVGESLYTIRAFAHGFIPKFAEKIAATSKNQDFNLVSIPVVTPTIEWVSFFGANTSFWNGPVQPGDVITAEDPDSVVCGSFTVTKKGKYGFMPVYGDDISTPDVDEGAQPGDRITFKINGINASTLGPDQPVWSNHGTFLQVQLCVERPVVIPLNAGWNLISWNVDTPVDSIQVLFAQIMANVSLVLGHENGGLTFDPRQQDLNTLKVLDHLHGYWLKMNQVDTLTIIGAPVDYQQTPIYCEPGWNLVSYLPDFPDSVHHALSSVLDNIICAIGFKNGGLAYDPDWPEFNTLNVLWPDYGYWIMLAAEDTLIYPEPLPGINLPYSPVMLPGVQVADQFHKGVLVPGNEWINVFGKGIMLDGKLLAPGTQVLAVDKDGIVCGEAMVTVPGSFGFMPVYRDEPRTEIDEGALPGEEITFYINDFKLPVTVTWSGFGASVDLGGLITSVDGGLRTVPEVYHVSNNYPNPFNPETSIKYQLPEPNDVSLKIFNILGQSIRTLIDEPKKAGFYTIIWDGRDDRGAPVATGIYIYKFKAGKFEMTKKMTLLK